MGEGLPFFSVLPSPTVNWIEVSGGSWKPDAAVLTKANASLRKSLAPLLKTSTKAWQRYFFQYQGNVATTGHRLIAISAFRDLPEEWRGNFDLTREWVQVLGGGSCCFAANYDSTSDVLLDLKVDAPA